MKKLFIFLVFVSTFLFSLATPTNAYSLSSPKVFNSWVDTNVQTVSINGVSYYEYTMDANQFTSTRYVLFYMLRPEFAEEPEFVDVQYISVDNGVTKLGVNYLSMGDFNLYETYNYSIKLYILDISPTPLETSLNFLNRYFSIYRGSIYDFITETNLFSGSYSAGLEEGLEQGELIGYQNGIDAIYNNGSDSVGYDENGSYDFNAGLRAGRNQNVNAGMTNFMTDFDKWIVPAILIIILLGGFTTIVIRKRSE